jgi:plastocyanin
VLVACLAAALGGCGDDTAPVPRAAGTAVMTDYEFHPRHVRAARGATLTVRNDGGIAHNLTLERGPVRVASTGSFLKGDREVLRVDLAPGRYTMICTVPGHRRLGMTGTFTVE